MRINARLNALLTAFPITNFTDGVIALNKEPYLGNLETESLKDFDLYRYLTEEVEVITEGDYDAKAAEYIKTVFVAGDTPNETYDRMFDESEAYNKETGVFTASGLFFQEWSPGRANGLTAVRVGDDEGNWVTSDPRDKNFTYKFLADDGWSRRQVLRGILGKPSMSPDERFQREVSRSMAWVLQNYDNEHQEDF